ncbi:MAG: metallopeptidase family protein [Planctomycetota bacterium]
MEAAERDRFDELVAEAIDELPPALLQLLEEVPVVVLDVPDAEMCRSLGMDASESAELCGLHTGVAETERSVEQHAELPSQIHLFRVGILAQAGGWEQADADDRVYEEIMVTLLHEIGHQFGLDEDQLRDLGYD